MSAPKLGINFKVPLDTTRGFDDPGAILDAMVGCWTDMQSSFGTLDAAGKASVISYVNE